jgi:hypothetical protein
MAGIKRFYFTLKSFESHRCAMLLERTRRFIKLGLPLFVCMRFQVCFTPLPGFFSPFPHGTCSLSVDYEYLALEDGPPMFRQGFSCPALLVATLVPPLCLRVRGYHPLWPDFPDCSTDSEAKDCRLFQFRSPLLSESRLISFPSGT